MSSSVPNPPPATPCDTPVDGLSHIHTAEPTQAATASKDTAQTAKKDFEKILTENLERLREEIYRARTKGATLGEAAKAAWSNTMADLEAKQKTAREKLGEVTTSSGRAWEHLREGATAACK